MSDRRFLTGVRAGNGSLYPTWRAGARSSDPDCDIALLDRDAVARTRPVAEPNDHARRDSGPSPLAGRRPLCKKHARKKHDIDPNIVTHHAVARSRPLTAAPLRRLFALRLVLSCMAASRYVPAPGRVGREMLKFIAWPLTQRPYQVVDLNVASF